MDSTWIPSHSMDSRWNPSHSMESRWNPSGMVMEYKSYSITIPDGNSIWNDGIHMESMTFHMDSRWNGIAEMAAIPAKTYSIWNGWNPYGMTWNPYGFHVEYGGRVKTS
jgi:hypothetical protein